MINCVTERTKAGKVAQDANRTAVKEKVKASDALMSVKGD